jgi:hypothetical protein
MIDLLALFDTLEAPIGALADEPRFSAHPIPSYEQHRIGKDPTGAPAILIATNDGAGTRSATPIVLEHLAVAPDILCRVSHVDGSSEEGKFTVIRCGGGDRALYTYFLRVMSALLVQIGPMPSLRDINRAIHVLVELFRAFTEPPKKSVQGLWAELFVIAQAHDLSIMIESWHEKPGDRYDFTRGDQCIEVKSAQGKLRQHPFSLEQLSPPSNTMLLIASVFVERSGAGVSVIDLVDELRAKIQDQVDLLLKVDRVVALTLGNTWRMAIEDHFDRVLAEKSLSFFEPSRVPCIDRNLPTGVSDVHFLSDLSQSPTAEARRFKLMQGLFQAAL